MNQIVQKTCNEYLWMQIHQCVLSDKKPCSLPRIQQMQLLFHLGYSSKQITKSLQLHYRELEKIMCLLYNKPTKLYASIEPIYNAVLHEQYYVFFFSVYRVDFLTNFLAPFRAHLKYKINFALKPLWVSLSGIDFLHFDTPLDGDALLSYSLGLNIYIPSATMPFNSIPSGHLPCAPITRQNQ